VRNAARPVLTCPYGITPYRHIVIEYLNNRADPPVADVGSPDRVTGEVYFLAVPHLFFGGSHEAGAIE
jgi:hypothetical protein